MNCKDCKYLYKAGRAIYHCHRYPKAIETFLDHWCGEFVQILKEVVVTEPPKKKAPTKKRVSRKK